MASRLYTLNVTTASDGTATVYIPSCDSTAGDYIDGDWTIESIVYTKTDFASGVDFAITITATGENVWVENDVNASKTVYPVAYAYDTTGTVTTAVRSLTLAKSSLKFAITSGGSAKTGTFKVRLVSAD